MIGIVGTVPDPKFPLTHGPVELNGETLSIHGRTVDVDRGTPALLAAAAKAATVVDAPPVYAFLIGDIGTGEPSRRLYDHLCRHLPGLSFDVLTFHYLQPDVDWHNKVLFAVEAMGRRPMLIADAGFMYAAKMSGQAPSYDFFTPDAGELAFLADDLAPHPFYTRGFILHQNDDVPALIQRAWEHRNTAAHLLVKGRTDRVVNAGRIVEEIDRPAVEAMEAIGGTGDTLTGMLTVLCGAGFLPDRAAALAAEANRRAGALADPNPATPIAALIDRIPSSLAETLNGKPR